VDNPVVAEDDFYTVYFSKGVLLEAQLIASQLRKDTSAVGTTGNVVQLFRDHDIGEGASRTMDSALIGSGLQSKELNLGSQQGISPLGEMAEAIGRLSAGDNLILWLRPQDLKALPATPPPGVHVYISGILAELNGASLPVGWRDIAHLTYPFDLPENRSVRMNFPLGWFKVRNIPVVAERVQSDTYLACGILSENLNDMLDSFIGDYLIERIEVMLSRKLTSAYYPRLGLAQHQRFASKGGYLAHFVDPEGLRVVADGDWNVPQ
jgi:hypothetical protein